MTRDRRTIRGEPGFVLVGVVMFVLALTILGLSLFSLSSYEATFMTRSLADLQAFQIASGAIERAKFALATTSQLESVQSNMPAFVDSTTAHQDRAGLSESTGGVAWDPDLPVLIRVQVNYRGAMRRMQSEFYPEEGAEYYKRLASVSDSMVVKRTGGEGAQAGADRLQRTYLSGEVHWNPPIEIPPGDSTWNADLPGPILPIDIRPVPTPDLDTYLGERWNTATPVAYKADCNWELGQYGQVSYYKTAASGTAEFSLRASVSSVIAVTGTVVWMFDRGFRSNHELRIRGSGSPEDCLILVGKPSDHTYDGEHYSIGVWCFGGIVSDSVPVIMVSDTEVRIEHFNAFDQPTRLPCASLFAPTVKLMGPATNALMQIGHLTPDDLIDRLTQEGALPSQGSGNRLAFIPGTWKESQP